MDKITSKHVCMLSEPPKCADIPPTASFRKYLLCRLRECILPCSWHFGSRAYIISDQRLRIERARTPYCVVHPYSAVAFYWGCFHMVLTFAVLLYIPFQVFMFCPNQYDLFILLTDALSFVHICFAFITGYVNEENKEIILNPRKNVRHYIRNNFFPDLIGALPLQLIELFDNCEYPSHTIMFIFKLFRLVTLADEWNNLLEQLGLSYIKKQTISVFVQIVIFFHWMTYLHYQIPAFTVHYFSTDERYKVWLKRFHVVLQKGTIVQQYIANLFLVCGLCIGAGHYSPVDEHIISELLLTTALGLIGLMFVTYSFAALLRLAIYRQYESYLFNGRCRELTKYMFMKRLPQYLQRKIQLFINYKFNGHYFNEAAIMTTINEQIKQDINMYSCKRLVMNVPLFQDMPVALINAIIFNLTQVLYMPGEVLVMWGVPGSSIYLISSGTVAVMSANGKEIAHLRDGSYFGETALLYPDTLRTATIIAIEITETYKLDSKQFQSCLMPYPHLKRRLEESYLKRRQTNPSMQKTAHAPRNN